MNYDGWLALPATVRQRLGLATGAELTIELVDGAIILRPVGKAGPTTAPSAEEALLPTAPPAEAASPEPAVTAPPPAKAKQGRPRKALADPALAPKPKARGRRAAAPALPTEQPT